MTFGKLNDSKYLLRLEKGEEVQKTLLDFCKKEVIKNGQVLGLGSIENPTLAHYRVDTKQYSEQLLDGIFEVTNLTGTIGIFEDQPLLHIHAALSDESMHSYAGHFVKGLVSATLEVIIEKFPTEYNKLHNEEIGLKLFDLPEKASNNK